MGFIPPLATVVLAALLHVAVDGAAASNTAGVDSAMSAARFVAELSRASPSHHGRAVRTYEIRDIDGDGKFEVLEHVNAYEQAKGFLNVEIEPAFDWITIYRERDGRFVEATGEFSDLLRIRRIHYVLWLRMFANPQSLNADSKQLVEKNRGEFRAILSTYVRRVDELLR